MPSGSTAYSGRLPTGVSTTRCAFFRTRRCCEIAGPADGEVSQQLIGHRAFTLGVGVFTSVHLPDAETSTLSVDGRRHVDGHPATVWGQVPGTRGRTGGLPVGWRENAVHSSTYQRGRGLPRAVPARAGFGP